jgi:hypothetical protein
MKRLFLAGAAAIVLAGAAHAADVPHKPVYKAPPPVAAPIPVSWTGLCRRQRGLRAVGSERDFQS